MDEEKLSQSILALEVSCILLLKQIGPMTPNLHIALSRIVIRVAIMHNVEMEKFLSMMKGLYEVSKKEYDLLKPQIDEAFKKIKAAGERKENASSN